MHRTIELENDVSSAHCICIAHYGVDHIRTGQSLCWAGCQKYLSTGPLDNIRSDMYLSRWYIGTVLVNCQHMAISDLCLPPYHVICVYLAITLPTTQKNFPLSNPPTMIEIPFATPQDIELSPPSSPDGFSISESLAPRRENYAAVTTDASFDGILKEPLQFKEDIKNGCGGQLWPAGMALAKYLLCRHATDLSDKTMWVRPSTRGLPRF